MLPGGGVSSGPVYTTGPQAPPGTGRSALWLSTRLGQVTQDPLPAPRGPQERLCSGLWVQGPQLQPRGDGGSL